MEINSEISPGLLVNFIENEASQSIKQRNKLKTIYYGSNSKIAITADP